MKLLENFIQFYPNSTTQIAHDQVPRNFWQEYGHFFHHLILILIFLRIGICQWIYFSKRYLNEIEIKYDPSLLLKLRNSPLKAHWS